VGELLLSLQPVSSLELPGLAASEDLKSPHFAVVEIISGGMGICIHVSHGGTGREYVLKMISPAGLQRESAYSRFIEEAKIWITLSSNEGIVPAYSIERVNEVPAICAKWMTHGSLRRYLSLKSPQFFYQTMDRIVRTLGWAWAIYVVVHRDLKPDNILFSSKDWPHVADWGIARTVLDHQNSDPHKRLGGHSPADLRLTMPGSFLGTIPYASPEQLVDAASADHRADIYSLGCIMFEWETGTPPFFEGPPEAIARAHLYKTPPQLGGWLKKSNFGTDKVIMKCLEKRPDNRFQNYEELSEALAVASKRRNISWNPIPISQSPLMPRVGWDQLQEHLDHDKSAVRSKDEGFALVDLKKYEPHFIEAAALIGLGEWQKAANILAHFFVPEMARSNPDNPFLQGVAINYATCLRKLGKSNEAVEIFRTISPATKKPVEFFVNYSDALNLARQYREAEFVAREGLRSFPSDKDILGNLTIALKNQEKLAEALEIATQRLKLNRNVHSLEEVAGVLHAIARAREEDDWPDAFAIYKRSMRLLEEAKGLNPRYETVRYSLAQTWFDLGEYSRANEELAEFFKMQMHPSLREMCVRLALECLLRVSLFKECIELADKWLVKLPGSVLLMRPRAEALVDGFVVGHVKDGVRLVEKSSLEFFESIVSNPEQRKASDFFFLARIKSWMGFTDEALLILSEASIHFVSAWNVPFHQANILFTSGDAPAALPLAREAVRKGRWHVSSWELLATICQTLSKFDEAKASKQKVSDILAQKEELTKSLVH
jgi:serine/threonine protein kinase